MINQMNQNENTQNKFSYTIKELKIGKLLGKSNISKNCSIHGFEVFQFLLLLLFKGKNLFRKLRAVSTEQRERARQMMLQRIRQRKFKENLMELCGCLW